jgi:5-methylcytosine-specific restriction endonuclease McrA
MVKKQFCREGHDKFAAGELPGGRCRTCRDEKNKARPKKPLTAEQKANKAENLRKWRASNPDKNREYDRKYYHENPEKYQDKSRKWREANPDYVCETDRTDYLRQYHIDNAEREKEYRKSRKHIQDQYNKTYYTENSAHISASSKAYYAANRQQVAAKTKARRAANPEKYRNMARAAKYNRKKALGKLTSAICQQVWDMGGGVCAYCSGQVFEESWELEHCTPISRGGTNFLDNLVVSCTDCNHKKFKNTVLEFLGLWPKVTKRYDFFNKEFVENNLGLPEKELAKIDCLKTGIWPTKK